MQYVVDYTGAKIQYSHKNYLRVNLKMKALILTNTVDSQSNIQFSRPQGGMLLWESTVIENYQFFLAQLRFKFAGGKTNGAEI
jgi:hypothetical protein